MRLMIAHERLPMRYRGGLLAAAALYLIAWPLVWFRLEFFGETVLRGVGLTLGALRFWEPVDPGWTRLFGVAGALTNLVFVIAVVIGWRLVGMAADPVQTQALRSAGRRLRHIGWLVGGCAAVNGSWWWITLPDSGWRVWRAGYYAWWASFVLLAVAIGRIAQHMQGNLAKQLPASGGAASASF